MIGSHQVDLGENFGPVKRCREILYVRNGVSIRAGDVVQSLVVTAGSPVSLSFLGDHVQRRCLGT